MKVNSYQRLAEHDLYAMVTVARDVQRKMLIEVNPDMHKGNAYLKLYNAASKQKASKVARISMYEPIYIEHANVGRKAGKKDWILNSKEKREFIAFLNSVQNGYTVWQKTILDYNKNWICLRKILWKIYYLIQSILIIFLIIYQYPTT